MLKSICERIGNVARHHRPLEEMDVVEPLDDARGVVDVLQQRFAIFALLDVDQMHGRTRGAVMDARALDQHVVPGILAVQREMPRRLLDRRQHQPARKAHAAVGAEDRAGPGQRLDAARDRIGEADRFQHGQHRFVDAFEVVLGQRLVAAAFETRRAPAGYRRQAAPPASPAAPRGRRNGATRLVAVAASSLQAPSTFSAPASPAGRPRYLWLRYSASLRFFAQLCSGATAVRLCHLDCRPNEPAGRRWPAPRRPCR